MVSPKEARRYFDIQKQKLQSIIYFRRAHLKDCFDSLKAEVPCQRDRKITNLQVLNLAIKYIQVKFLDNIYLKKILFYSL